MALRSFFFQEIYSPQGFNSSPLKRYRIPSQKEAESSSKHRFFKGSVKALRVYEVIKYFLLGDERVFVLISQILQVKDEERLR